MVWSLVLISFDSGKLGTQKKQIDNTIDYFSRDMSNFDFLGKSVGISFSAHIAYYFSRKTVIMLYFIIWLNFIAWLLLLLDILVQTCIAIFVNQLVMS